MEYYLILEQELKVEEQKLKSFEEEMLQLKQLQKSPEQKIDEKLYNKTFLSLSKDIKRTKKKIDKLTDKIAKSKIEYGYGIYEA